MPIVLIAGTDVPTGSVVFYTAFSTDLIVRRTVLTFMGEVDEETAIEIAETYADEGCVGELGEILAVTSSDANWIVEFRTHTYDDFYDHRVVITKTVGNIISHDRSDRFD